MTRSFIFGLLVVSVAGIPLQVRSDPIQIEAIPKRVAMFKNGVGLVALQADLPQPEGSFVLSPLPEATFGSFWLNWTDAITLERVITRQADVMETIPGGEVARLLQKTYGADAQLVIDGLSVRRRAQRPVLAFDAVPQKGGGEPGIGLTYMSMGIAWSPSFAVHLNDGKPHSARFFAKAVIVNDLMDLNSTDIELIAGYPNLRFADTPSALKLDPLPQLLNQLRAAGQRMDTGILSNSMLLQQRLSYAREAPGSSIPSMPSTPVAGEDAEDLYFYQLQGVSLKKGDRGYFPLFVAEVPYEHQYTWDIPDFIDENNNYQRQLAERVEVVWHVLKLTNTTNQPWTTGAAMTMKNDRVIGQDMLAYTPPGASTLLKITQAVSVDAQQNEYEIKRQHDAKKFNGYSHDLVTIAGELELTNYKSKPVEVVVTKVFSGELQEADGEHEIKKLARGLRRINPRSQIQWCVNVTPGKDDVLKIKYRYQVYTR